MPRDNLGKARFAWWRATRNSLIIAISEWQTCIKSPYICSDRLHPSAMMLFSMVAEQPDQLQCYLCCVVLMPLFAATTHTVQNLLHNPTNRSFWVWFPKITATLVLVLNECLWAHIDQLPSIMTVILGTYWWKLFVAIAWCFSFSATFCIEWARCLIS